MGPIKDYSGDWNVLRYRAEILEEFRIYKLLEINSWIGIIKDNSGDRNIQRKFQR